MRIVFATNNEHKLSEIRGILSNSNIDVLSLSDIGCHADIPETGETLEENALQKAQYVYDHYHMDCFADDTGLEVEALNGAPGVHTARFADEVDHDAEANTRKLLRVMADKDNRKARFRTAIALILSPLQLPQGGEYRTAEPSYYGLLKDFAKENKKHSTEAESIMWELLSKKQTSFSFRRQHIIGKCIVDFVCLERKLIIEIDGGYHSEKEQIKLDEERTLYLNKKGFQVIRFTNEKVICEPDNVKAEVQTALSSPLGELEGAPIFFEGIVNGEITREKRGDKGFGYDPVFKPDGYDGTFAELGVDVKNQISHRAIAVQKLVKYLSSLALFFLFAFLPVSVSAQIGTWKAYMAYSDVQDIQAGGDELYVQASNGLYTYNLTDQSITTYDKINGLSETSIKFIKWNPTAKKLLIVYQNQNMDVMEEGGEVTNLSDLYQKSMTADKTVNSIYAYQQYAYLACGFGIVKVDMQRIEISDSYNLGANIDRVAIKNNQIYARQQNGQVLTAALNANLLDPSNWSITTSYDSSIFNIDRSDYNKYRETVSQLQPGGPTFNAFGFMRFHNNKLYTSNAAITVKNNTGCVQVFDGTDWSIYETDLRARLGHPLFQIFSLDIDPNDDEHVYAGGQTGLLEFRDGKFVKEYSNDNGSPLQTAATVGNNNKEYVIVSSVKYGADSHLWCFNSIAPSRSLLELTDDKTWTKHDKKEFFVYDDRSLEDIRAMMFDSRGLLWMANNMHRMPCVISYNPKTDEVMRYDNRVNQDGTSLITFMPNSLAEDKEGNIWLGTNSGPYYLSKSIIENNSNDYYFTQVKVPRNDGTNYADYLLGGVQVTCMLIDGGNRKWFGTENDGVYLISADNYTQLQHFTTQNSPLLSDNIVSIAINEANGEVFFGTENGLCSYISDTTTPTEEMTSDNVYAYPNPVAPEYNGLITITGLTYDADVKILSSSGKLIAEGRSTGGSFTWNGRDKDNKRVASGVYMVATATSDGQKGTVCKIVMMK